MTVATVTKCFHFDPEKQLGPPEFCVECADAEYRAALISLYRAMRRRVGKLPLGCDCVHCKLAAAIKAALPYTKESERK